MFGLGEFQRTMVLLMFLATLVFILVLVMMVSPKVRGKFLEFFPTFRGRNGKPFTGKEVIGMGVMALFVAVVLLL